MTSSWYEAQTYYVLDLGKLMNVHEQLEETRLLSEDPVIEEGLQECQNPLRWMTRYLKRDLSQGVHLVLRSVGLETPAER